METEARKPGDGKPQREGFIREAPPPNGGRQFDDMPAPAPEPPSPQPVVPPRAPLPSQMKLEQPPPEAPLSIHDQARRDIADSRELWPITVQLLYKPIKNDKGEEVTALTFREPRATEINRIGNPTRMLWDGEVVIEERKMTYIMGALCGILPVLLEEMDPRDWNSCALRLRRFFLPDLRAW